MEYKVTEIKDNQIDFGNMDNSFFLIGLLNEFMNRFQSVGDRFFKEISWKQCFVLICIKFFKTPPTLKELSMLMGSSHQNIKVMLNKLEKLGYIQFINDDFDKRKKRIILTNQAIEFDQQHAKQSNEMMKELFSNVDVQDLQITIKTITKLDDNLKEMQK